jgi:hypothetical protein
MMLFLEFKLMMNKMKTTRLKLSKVLLNAPLSIGVEVDVVFGLGLG